MMKQAAVAIVIVNWNGYKDTIECLESLNSNLYSNFKVFLVDNCSKNNSYELLQQDIDTNRYHYDIELMQTEENLGFAGGNNFALKKAMKQNYKYYWLLNNDTIAKADSLSLLVDFLDKNSNVGITGSKIYYNNTNMIWFVGGKFNRKTGKIAHIGYKDVDHGSYNQITEVDYITGCSMLVRHSVFEEIGLMKEDYFLYFEETDFNVRARKKGWDIKINPQSVIYHKVSISSGGEQKNQAPYVAYYDLRNGYWICKRNFSGLHVRAFLYMMYKSVKKIGKIYLLNQPQKGTRLKYIYHGVIDALIKP
ncbi:glycosyltransferase family 2 protein [Sporolactobacillus terrae]|uniref:glycosyltransferase family 2 protein n=1 Tax=Sporolactobacillus terrae TaxID=269673 RepID=UPI00159BD35F|nr:glycosyltransferase family 2 protein [Sporolactobacillus terrae]